MYARELWKKRKVHRMPEEKKKSAEKTEAVEKEKPAEKGRLQRKEKKAVSEKKEGKEEKKKRMIKAKTQKGSPKKSGKAREAKKLVKLKPKKPQFRGRFGKNSIRRKNKPKWMKWRVPRGKDLDKTGQYGKTPKSGYRAPKKARGIHPSGYREVLVQNPEQLKAIERETMAARISSRVGKKKRNEIVKKANELNIKILN